MVDSFPFIGLNQTLLSAEINGSIVGFAAFIDDGNFDAHQFYPKHSRRDRPIAGGIHRRRRPPTAQRQSGHDGLLTSL